MSIILFLSSILGQSIDLNPVDVQEWIQIGLGYAYVENFDSARVHFEKIIEEHPDNPAGYFFMAALLQVKMMDECQYTEEQKYLSLIRTTIQRAEQILTHEENLWAQYYLGNTYTYRAVFEGFKGNYFETFKYGMKGGKILQDIIKKDTTFYDAYLGAGTYEYFWARAARYLPVLKLVGGNVDEALRKLNIAATHSLHSRTTALNSLVFIYGEEKKYEKADSIVARLLNAYPHSKTFLWSKAELAYKKKDYQKAVQLYDTLFVLYDRHNPKNYANCAQCRLYIGKCYYELKCNDLAKAALKDVIAYKEHADIYPQIKGYCREAYGLLSRIF
jgi:tetratricopeptide (TPR) repeat protein